MFCVFKIAPLLIDNVDVFKLSSFNNLSPVPNFMLLLFIYTSSLIVTSSLLIFIIPVDKPDILYAIVPPVKSTVPLFVKSFIIEFALAVRVPPCIVKSPLTKLFPSVIIKLPS